MIKNYDLIIVGGGPAGLTAAIYAKRALLKILLLEKELLGGKLNKTDLVDNYPGLAQIGGSELAQQMTQHLNNYQIPTQTVEVTMITKKAQQFLLTGSREEQFLTSAVIIASGTLENKLQIPGEERLANHGASYCVVCDGFLFKDQVVAIVGGGYSALEAALYMSNVAQKVYLLHRREEFSVDPEILLQVKNKENVSIITNCSVKEVRGQTKVESLLIDHNNQEKTLEVAAIFPCIGLLPSSKSVQELDICDSQKYIQIKDDCSTNIPGLFAAGDVARSHSKKIKQIVTAIAEGAVAAQSAISYLK